MHKTTKKSDLTSRKVNLLQLYDWPNLIFAVLTSKYSKLVKLSLVIKKVYSINSKEGNAFLQLKCNQIDNYFHVAEVVDNKYRRIGITTKEFELFDL